MRIVRDYQFTRPEDRGAAVAIGNFDGVHRGHAHVIDLARRPGAPLGVVTFEPHPREFFAPDAPPFRLMNAEARANRLEKLGVELLAELPFDAGLSGLTADAFARDVLGPMGLASVTSSSGPISASERAARAMPGCCASLAGTWGSASRSPRFWRARQAPFPRPRFAPP
jgi:hypothetical protein